MKQYARFLWAAVVIASAFFAGYMLGGTAARDPGDGAPDLLITRTELLDALEPTPDQRAQLEQIMETTRSRSDSIMRGLLGEIRDLTADAESRMRSILTPEQAARLDSLISRPTPRRLRRTQESER